MSVEKQSAWKLARPGSTIGLSLIAATLLSATVLPLAKHYRETAVGGTEAEIRFHQELLKLLSQDPDLVVITREPVMNNDPAMRKLEVMTYSRGRALIDARERAFSDHQLSAIGLALENVQLHSREASERALDRLKSEVFAAAQALTLSFGLGLAGVVVALVLLVRRPGLRRPEAAVLAGTSTGGVRFALGGALALFGLSTQWWLPILGPDTWSEFMPWNPPPGPLILQWVGMIAIVASGLRTAFAKPKAGVAR